MLINTQQDWWNLLDNNWTHITGPLVDELNIQLGSDATEDLTINGKTIGMTCIEDLEQARSNKDWSRILSYFNAFWIHAPDEPWIHTIPGWGALCDLCSEYWVFEENNNDIKA